jgi:hypothetical protein
VARSRDKRAFLERNPVCCICGGNEKATTVEHAPPLSLFVERTVPGAFWFPACLRCNNGSGEADQIAALSTLIMGGATASHVKQAYLDKLLHGVANNSPEFFSYFGSRVEETKIRINGLIRDTIIVDIDREVHRRWLEPWGVKQALAFWYKHTGKILSEGGGVFLHWITNAGIPDHSDFLKTISSMQLGFNEVKQGSQSFREQFHYRFGLSDDLDYGTFLFAYHDSSVIWAGVFESMGAAMRFNSLPIYRTSSLNGIELYSYPIISSN